VKLNLNGACMQHAASCGLFFFGFLLINLNLHFHFGFCFVIAAAARIKKEHTADLLQ